MTAMTWAGSSPCFPVPITVTGIEQILSRWLPNGHTGDSSGNLRDDCTANLALGMQARWDFHRAEEGKCSPQRQWQRAQNRVKQVPFQRYRRDRFALRSDERALGEVGLGQILGGLQGRDETAGRQGRVWLRRVLEESVF